MKGSGEGLRVQVGFTGGVIGAEQGLAISGSGIWFVWASILFNKDTKLAHAPLKVLPPYYAYIN